MIERILDTFWFTLHLCMADTATADRRCAEKRLISPVPFSLASPLGGGADGERELRRTQRCEESRTETEDSSITRIRRPFELGGLRSWDFFLFRRWDYNHLMRMRIYLLYNSCASPRLIRRRLCVPRCIRFSHSLSLTPCRVGICEVTPI